MFDPGEPHTHRGCVRPTRLRLEELDAHDVGYPCRLRLLMPALLRFLPTPPLPEVTAIVVGCFAPIESVFAMPVAVIVHFLLWPASEPTNQLFSLPTVLRFYRPEPYFFRIKLPPYRAA